MIREGTNSPAELKAILIAPSRELGEALTRTLSETRAFRILAELKNYPNDQVLESRVHELGPEVVLLDVASDLGAACGLTRRLSSLRPPIPVIALDAARRPEVVMRLLRQGAREYLSAPFTPMAQADAAGAIARLRQPQPPQRTELGRIVAFSSAKPGSGASTLAWQTALALQRKTGGRVLLVDLDLAAGTVSYYTARQSRYSFLDILEGAGEGMAAGWNDTAVDGLDILAAPDKPGDLPLDSKRFRQALDRLRERYTWILLDLPTVFHRVSLLALANVEKTFVVSTTELPSLHLARKAVRLLGRLGIAGGLFEVVINQIGRREGITAQELEKVLGCKLRFSMPDDHSRLHRAVALGGAIDADSALGEAIEGLAGRMTGPLRKEPRKADFGLDIGALFART